MKSAKLSIILAAAAALAVSAVAFADTPGRHPRYLHARTDLRTAQFLLRVQDEPNVMRHVRQADREIDQAVVEIDRAAVLDRKYIEDHPPIDRSLDRRGRFRKAMALLVGARADIGREEDNPRAAGWRNAAYRHIDAAMDQLRRAARDLHMDHLEGF
ncbi:MAG: hypothetical protein ABSB23_01515 [Bryobacteraceae bacterium]|jgi:hypothetical protein